MPYGRTGVVCIKFFLARRACVPPPNGDETVYRNGTSKVPAGLYVTRLTGATGDGGKTTAGLSVKLMALDVHAFQILHSVTDHR